MKYANILLCGLAAVLLIASCGSRNGKKKVSDPAADTFGRKRRPRVGTPIGSQRKTPKT